MAFQKAQAPTYLEVIIAKLGSANVSSWEFCKVCDPTCLLASSSQDRFN